MWSIFFQSAKKNENYFIHVQKEKWLGPFENLDRFLSALWTVSPSYHWPAVPSLFHVFFSTSVWSDSCFICLLSLDLIFCVKAIFFCRKFALLFLGAKNREN